MLTWNANKVNQLTGGEIWMMIVGRVLIGFGIGALCMQVFPKFAGVAAVPAVILGLVILGIAARGMMRSNSDKSETSF
jgi:hypothetical protein